LTVILTVYFFYSIADILREIRKAGFVTPSPIQVFDSFFHSVENKIAVVLAIGIVLYSSLLFLNKNQEVDEND